MPYGLDPTRPMWGVVYSCGPGGHYSPGLMSALLLLGCILTSIADASPPPSSSCVARHARLVGRLRGGSGPQSGIAPEYEAVLKSGKVIEAGMAMGSVDSDELQLPWPEGSDSKRGMFLEYQQQYRRAKDELRVGGTAPRPTTMSSGWPGLGEALLGDSHCANPGQSGVARLFPDYTVVFRAVNRIFSPLALVWSTFIVEGGQARMS